MADGSRSPSIDSGSESAKPGGNEEQGKEQDQPADSDAAPERDAAGSGGQPEAPSKPTKANGTPLFNCSHCMYDVVVAEAEARGWKPVRTEAKAKACNVHWIDDCTYQEWFSRVEPWMRINHFPGLFNALARKSRLARNLARIQRIFPSEYQFLPETWVVPDDMSELEKKFDEAGKSKVIYIAKPDAGTQGRGIFLFNTLDRIKKACAEKDSAIVVQRYISRPMLIEGLKFDLRLYLLVCALPAEHGRLVPRYFLHRDGLVRLCTTEYVPPTDENLDQRRMHLTNYAINKKSKDFVQNEDPDDDGAGSKRSLRWFMDDYLPEECGDKERDKLWTKLKGLCVKMLLAVHPTLEAEYFTAFPRDLSGGSVGCRCFEVLGVDVMLDRKRRPYLIEINHLPSFTCDSPLDEDIKSRVVRQSMDIACGQISAGDRSTYEALASSGNAPNAQGPPAEVEPVLMDADSYEDFVRVYPALADTPKLSSRYEAIFTRVREVFRPVAVAQRQRPSSASPAPNGSGGSGHAARQSSREPTSAAAPRLPPRPPKGGGAGGSTPNAASSPSSAVAAGGQGLPLQGRRSRSAPVRASELSLPGLSRPAGSPTPPPGKADERGYPPRVSPVPRRPASRQPVARLRQQQIRQSLSLGSAKIML